MAKKKSKENPWQWPDGSWHSISYTRHLGNVAQKQGTPTPTVGTYDPDLDAKLRASGRGLSDLLNDIGSGEGNEPLGTQRIRAQTDFTSGLGALDVARRRADEDYATARGSVEQGYQRNLSDLLKAREQGQQDYGTNVGNLQRSYERLGVSQGENQRKAGAFASSGAAAQAARKRSENQAIDRAPIDTAYNRFMESSQQSEGRLGQDRQTALDDLLRAYTRQGENFSTQGLDLQKAFERQGQDWTTQLTRAQREATEFGGDINAAKIAQFTQNRPGMALPVIPAAIPKGQQVYAKVKGRPVTYDQYQAGDAVYRKMVDAAKKKNKKVV